VLALDLSAVSNGVEMVRWGRFCEEDGMLARPWWITRNLPNRSRGQERLRGLHRHHGHLCDPSRDSRKRLVECPDQEHWQRV